MLGGSWGNWKRGAGEPEAARGCAGSRQEGLPLDLCVLCSSGDSSARLTQSVLEKELHELRVTWESSMSLAAREVTTPADLHAQDLPEALGARPGSESTGPRQLQHPDN